MAAPRISLLRYLRPYRWQAALGFVCVSGYIGTSLWTPSLVGNAIDALQDQTSTAHTFLALMGLYLAAAATAFLVSIGMRRLMLGLANRVEHDIRRDIFDHLTGMDLAFFQRERTGDLMTKMTSDLSAVREMIGQGLLQGARMTIGFPLAFAIMFATNVQLALVVTALLPLVSLLFFFLIRWIHKYYDACQDQFSAISNFAQETFSGIRTIKGFALEPRQRDEFRQHNEEYIRRNMTLTRIEEPVWPFMMFLYWFAAMLLLLVAGHQIIEGTLKLSVFVKFQFYLLFLQWPMLALGWTANLFQRGRTSWARIKTILEAEPAIKSEDDSSKFQVPSSKSEEESSKFQVQSSRSDSGSSSTWNFGPGTLELKHRVSRCLPPPERPHAARPHQPRYSVRPVPRHHRPHGQRKNPAHFPPRALD